MSDYIKKSKTIEALKARGEQLYEETKGTEYIPLIRYFQQAMNIVETMPSANVVERELYERALSDVIDLSMKRKIGKWARNWDDRNGFSYAYETCSECGYSVDVCGYNFCPNCGARMVEKEI